MDWTKNTDGSEVKIVETHENTKDEYKDVQWGWYTKYDLYSTKHAWAQPEQKAYCDKLMDKSKSKANDDQTHKNDPDMKIYRIHLRLHNSCARVGRSRECEKEH